MFSILVGAYSNFSFFANLLSLSTLHHIVVRYERITPYSEPCWVCLFYIEANPTFELEAIEYLLLGSMATCNGRQNFIFSGFYSANRSVHWNILYQAFDLENLPFPKYKLVAIEEFKTHLVLLFEKIMPKNKLICL